jgi:hypothetical protein
MFMGTEPRSVAKTVRSIGPIRSIRRPPNRSAVSTITVSLIPEKVRPNRWGVPKRRLGERTAGKGNGAGDDCCGDAYHLADTCWVHTVSLSGPFTRRKGRKAPLSAGPMALPVPATPDTPKDRFRRLGNRRRQPPPWVLLKSRPNRPIASRQPRTAAHANADRRRTRKSSAPHRPLTTLARIRNSLFTGFPDRRSNQCDASATLVSIVRLQYPELHGL